MPLPSAFTKPNSPGLPVASENLLGPLPYNPWHSSAPGAELTQAKKRKIDITKNFSNRIFITDLFSPLKSVITWEHHFPGETQIVPFQGSSGFAESFLVKKSEKKLYPLIEKSISGN